MARKDKTAARSAILGRISQSIASMPGHEDRTRARQEALERLAQKERGIVPRRAQVGRYEQVAMFMDYAERAASSTERVSSYDAVPGAIAAYLRGRNLPQKIRMGSDARLAAIRWDQEPQLDYTVGASDGSDPVGVSHAFGAVAETGTAIFTSGTDNPTTLNFLPETQIIIVNADDIAGDYESVQDNLRDFNGRAVMPRAVNFITGPSRSGDIEQTLLLGAHGPRDVHVIVVG